jgi:hypothetical protein
MQALSNENKQWRKIEKLLARTLCSQTIFMKCANWVPLDMFIDGMDDVKYRYFIESFLVVNGNSLRVWVYSR